MGFADVRHDADSRLGNGRQLGNLPQAAHAHLDDAGFVPFRQLQQRARQADFVVEIFSVCSTSYFCDRTEAIIFRVDVLPTEPVTATTGMENGGDGSGPKPDRPSAYRLRRKQQCRTLYSSRISTITPAAPLLHGFADKIMTVKPLALEGYKQRVPADDPRIRFHAGK